MGESRLLDLLGHGPTSQQIKVTRHRGSTPIFKANHIEPQLEDLISRDINLPFRWFHSYRSYRSTYRI